MLRAENVFVRFRKGIRRRPITALNGFNLDVREGEFLALIGENGAGKSTAMYCFLGLTRPTSGRVMLFGEPPDLGSAVYGRIAYLPEDPHYHLYLTVHEAVTFYASLFDSPVPKERIDTVLDRLGLKEFRDLRLSKCSKGMKQKVGIAQCLLHAPSVLFLDEPMRGLDPIVVREFREILRELHRNGATIVMNSHILSEVEAMATRVAILDRGKVVLEDTVANLTRPSSDFYDVELEADGETPEYLTVQSHVDHRLKGHLPARHFHDFMTFVRERGLVVSSCVLTRRTLEESFYSVVRKDRTDA